MIKNIPYEKICRLENIINVKKNQILSKCIISGNVDAAVFAFSGKEMVSEEEYNADVMYLVLNGNAVLSTGSKEFHLIKDDVLCIEAGVLHKIEANEDFKMLQINCGE